MTKRLTMKAVNKAIAHTGLELIKGEGYFYCIGHGVEHVNHSIYTYALNHADLAYWVHEVERIAAEIAAHFAWEAQFSTYDSNEEA